MKRRSLFYWLIHIVWLVTGCASHQALTTGQELIKNGQYEDGLALLDRLVQENPMDVQYLSAYARQKELAEARLLMRADIEMTNGEIERAEVEYRRVLRINANSARAINGLKLIDIAKKHSDLVKQAKEMYGNGDFDGAEEITRNILSENPKQNGAKDLWREIQASKAKLVGAKIVLKPSITKPVTIEFKDAPLRSIFEALTMSSGINFVLDKEVRSDQRATIFIKDASIEDAIHAILASNQLGKKIINDTTVLIYPDTPAKTKDYQDLVVRTFYLANSDAKNTLNLLKTILKSKDVYVDERLNILVMRDTPEAIRVAEKLIAVQDLGDPEVILDMEVLEVSTNRLNELGIRYPDQINASVAGAAGAPGVLSWAEFKNFNSDLVSVKVPDPSLVLNFKKTDTDTNILANPRIRVKNRDKAKVHIGERVPVITTTTTANVGVSESVTYLDVGLKLDVEPNIFLDDEVLIKVGLEVSNILDTITRTSGTQTYRLGTRNTETSLRLKDGETQILAGLVQDIDRSSANKVPGMGDFPILGRLFSSNNDSRAKTEIVLLITPHVVRGLLRPEAEMAEFYSGTETSLSSDSRVHVPIMSPSDRNPVAAPSLSSPPARPREMGGRQGQ